jgi:hypothetical protein
MLNKSCSEYSIVKFTFSPSIENEEIVGASDMLEVRSQENYGVSFRDKHTKDKISFILDYIGKGDIVPVHTMKAYAPLLLSLGSIWRWVVSFMPHLLPPRVRAPLLIEQEAWWAPSSLLMLWRLDVFVPTWNQTTIPCSTIP